MAHLNEIKSELEQVMARIDELVDSPELSEDERTELAAKETRADELLKQAEQAKVREDRKAATAALPTTTAPIKLEPETRVEVTRNERTYREGDAPGDKSYFRDLWHATTRGDYEARDRLIRNNLEARDLTRTDTSSVGEFVPPAWLLELYQPGIRATKRVTANLVRHLPLPAGTDSLNVPRISTGPTVAAQTADNNAVNEVDAVSATVTAAVNTFAGQNDVAIQVLDQSPLAGGFDSLIFSELMADLDRYVDAQVINGSGTAGQVKGFVPVAIAGSQKVAYTDASPTVVEFFTNLSAPKVVSLITTARKDTVDAFVMHPRRWYWLMSGLDSSNRPLVVPTAGGPNNADATQSVGGAAEGSVGQLLGIPVYLDPNIPVLLTNGAGAAGTEDIILAAHFQDAILFESNVRTRVLPEVLSGTLEVRLQVYEYAAFTAERATSGVGCIYDTGMAAVSGF